MKKIFSLITLLVACLFVFFGCSNNKKVDDGKIQIVATNFALYDFAKEIGGNNVNVSMLLKPGEEAHSYEPTTKDIKDIKNCDLFIYTGGESDEWVSGILDSLGKKNGVLKLIDKVDTMNEELKEGMADNSEEKGEVELDEHIWTSPKNAIIISENIKQALISIDDNNKDFYEQNYNSYKSKLKELDEKFELIVNNAKRKTVIFADRFPLAYFVKDYGLNYYAAFPGCSTDTDTSASTVAFLIKKVKANKIPVVFYIEFSNEKMADTIVKSTKAKKLSFQSCHNVTKDDFNKGVTYITIMEENAKNLKEALY